MDREKLGLILGPLYEKVIDQILALFEIEAIRAEEEHTSHLIDDVIRLEEELKVGNALTAKLTDQCRELEAQLGAKK